MMQYQMVRDIAKQCTRASRLQIHRVFQELSVSCCTVAQSIAPINVVFSFRRVYTKREPPPRCRIRYENEWSNEQNESIKRNKEIAVDIIERVFSPMVGTSHGSEHTGYDVKNDKTQFEQIFRDVRVISLENAAFPYQSNSLTHIVSTCEINRDCTPLYCQRF